MPPRARHTADVGQLRHAVSVQERDEIVERPSMLRSELGVQFAMRRVQRCADAMRRFDRPRHRIARALEPCPHLGQFGRLT